MKNQRSQPLVEREHQANFNLNRAQKRAIRFKQVLEIVPLCPSRIYELIATDPDFPKSFKLVKGGHAAAFWEHEIYDWLERAASKGGA